MATTFLLAQADALPRLCNQLKLATGLRELVLDLNGRAACAVTCTLPRALSSLTQLNSLQLHGVTQWPSYHAGGEQLRAVLLPLSQLTRLGLRLEPAHEPAYDENAESDNDDVEYDAHWNYMDMLPYFPWQRTVCELTKLQELDVSIAAAMKKGRHVMFKGALPSALSQLTALRRLSVLGMELWHYAHDLGDESSQLQLEALPALETVALRLHTFYDSYPGLCNQQPIVLSRLVSLSLTLQFEYPDELPMNNIHMPAIVAPALTELILDGSRLALDCEQLSWLPGLPVLRRLVLKNLKTASSELPHGISECSGLTALVLERIMVSFDYDPDSADDSSRYGSWSLFRSLPAAGPYLSELRRISLSGNAFTRVPPSLVAATALEMLDLTNQRSPAGGDEQQAPRVHGLHVLGSMSQCMDLSEFSQCGIRRFQASRPNVTVIL